MNSTHMRNRESYGLFRRYITPAIVGLGILGAIGLNRGLKQSENLTKYLRNPTAICLNMPDYATLEFIKQYKKETVEYAKEYNVPPEMVAAVTLSENFDRRRYEDWKDWLAAGATAKLWDKYLAPTGGLISKRLGYTDPSLGPNQIKISTAQALDKKFGKERKSREQLETLLQVPVENIKYAAQNLSDLIHRDNRLSNGSVKKILDNPHLITVIGSEHAIGGRAKPLDYSEPSPEGLSYAVLLAETNFQQLLGQASTITTAQQQGISEYIEQQLKKNPKLGSRVEEDKKFRKDAAYYYNRLPC